MLSVYKIFILYSNEIRKEKIFNTASSWLFQTDQEIENPPCWWLRYNSSSPQAKYFEKKVSSLSLF